MKKLFLLFIFVGSFVTLPVYANIYKCTDENGVTTFSDQPCAKNAEAAFSGSSSDVAGSSSGVEGALWNFSATLSGSATGAGIAKFKNSKIYPFVKSVGIKIFPGAEFERVQAGETIYGVDSEGKPARYEYVWAIFKNNSYQVGIGFQVQMDPSKNVLYKVAVVKTSKNWKPFNAETLKGAQKFKKLETGTWKR